MGNSELARHRTPMPTRGTDRLRRDAAAHRPAGEADRTRQAQSKLVRDLLLGFAKIHVLNRAEQQPIYGVGIAAELARHGYNLIPGIYPLLHSMEAAKYLKREHRVLGGRARKYYRITPHGRRALDQARRQVGALVNEVMRSAPRDKIG